MKGKSIVTINGRSYDAVTGFPVDRDVPAAPARRSMPLAHRPAKQPAPAQHPHRAFSDIAPQRVSQRHITAAPKPKALPTLVAKQPQAQTAHAVHQQPQRTQTLHRAALKRPATPHPSTIKGQRTRSPLISKFAPQMPVGLQPATEEIPAIQEQETPAPPSMHPTVTKALERHTPSPLIKQKAESPQALKERLIKQRLAEIDAKATTEKRPKQRFAMQPRLATIFTSAFALLLLGGYLTYINLPNLSMRVAAARAGVAAKFPNYQPDGYRFDGPISYAPGEVTINFKSNTNDSRFSIKQKASNWDSQAVLDNYVAKESTTYLTYQERGLTIYAFNNKAAWVSGGLLYTIDGDASLSSEQILRMATSI